MRNNQPVTQREYHYADDATLMSTTDAHSRIVYANAAFIEASGFSREQLQGQPHNIVRHPDMPPEAFADMWATLKRGEPWTGLVKNRRSNGDHYWVRANAMPVVRGGATTGYMSVRTKPSRDEVAAAEALYRDFREGRPGGRRLEGGLVAASGWRGAPARLRNLPARWKIRAATALTVPLVGAAAAVAGLAGPGLAGLAAAAAGAALLADLVLEAQIARPLERMRAQALAVASGATQRVDPVDRIDEIGITLRAVGQLGLMFRWLIDDVSGQVMNVQTATSEIAQGNNDLASRTEQAAASVEQTASSMEEMTASVNSNAESTGEAHRLSGDASTAAGEGGRVVAQVVETMSEIAQSSRRIADIIGTIDGIAFQTNILALNAAVEAARAGEQGRGFAVVAGEVRALATRSADAAREIKSLIGASVERVEQGGRLVDAAGRTMDGIVAQVKRVSDLISEISSTTREQSGGIAQVGQAISHLDQITQQNAALVEQSASASESLRSQADRLAEAVGVFRG